MSTGSAIFCEERIIPSRAESLLTKQKITLGELLCGLNQQLLKCVLALKLLCT